MVKPCVLRLVELTWDGDQRDKLALGNTTRI